MSEKVSTFALDFVIVLRVKMVGVAQLVRVPDCGSEGRGFEPHLPPQEIAKQDENPAFLLRGYGCRKLFRKAVPPQ